MGKKIREEQIDFIKKIKTSLQYRPLQWHEVQHTSLETPEETKSKTPGKGASVTLDELVQRMEKIEKELEIAQPDEGIRKSKVKEQIISLLKERGKISSIQLSDLIALSRTRCNEYFRELTKEGLTEGIIIGRKKYYKLVRR